MWDVPWPRLRFQHAQALRSALADRYAHTTANRILSVLRGAEPGPLFRGLGNRNRRGRLTDQAVYNILRKRTKLAGVAKLSPHDFRRTFVGDLLDAGADIVTVQKMAGHADPATTSRYDRRDKRAQHKAASLPHVPYQKRSLDVE